MTEHRSPIPARVYNAAVGGHVCGPDDIDFGQKVIHLIKYDRDGNEVSFESQVTQANKIYVIHDDFILSSNVNILSNCTLQFDGGSISGAYTLTGNNTNINAGLVKIFGTDITLGGTWNVAVSYPEWFDVSDIVKTRNAIQKAVSIADHIVLSGNYNVQNSVYNPNEDMYAQRQLIIGGTVTEDYITVGSGKTIEITGKVKATSPLTDLFRVEGDCTIFCGGGIIEGCSVVNDYNDADTPSEAWKQWEASLIRIEGNNNKVNNIKLIQPTTNCVYIKGSTSINNVIENNTIGGGSVSHGTGTKLFGVHTEGLNTIVANNTFKAINNKKLYSAIYSTGLNDILGTSFVLDSNHIDGMLEHAVYAYSKNVIISNNYITNCHSNFIQLMNEISIIENNRLEVSSEQIDDNNIENFTGIFAQKHSHTIKNNKFIKFTDYAIYFSDTHIVSNNGINNIFISNNTIELYAGYLRGPVAVGIYSGESNVTDIRIENNIIECKNLGAVANTSGYIYIIINNDNFVGKNISICKNSISNCVRSAIHIATSDNAASQGLVLFYDVTISENNIIDCCRSSASYSNREASIQLYGIDRLNMYANHVSYTQSGSIISGDEIPFCRIFNLTNCKNYFVTNNISSHYIKTGQGRGFTWFGLSNTNKGNITRNEFDGLQEGVFTITNGNASYDVNYIALNYLDNTNDYCISIIPLNAAAIELQNSANYILPYIYEDSSSGSNWVRMVRFKTNTNVEVSADCKFAFNLQY